MSAAETTKRPEIRIEMRHRGTFVAQGEAEKHRIPAAIAAHWSHDAWSRRSLRSITSDLEMNENQIDKQHDRSCSALKRSR